MQLSRKQKVVKVNIVVMFLKPNAENHTEKIINGEMFRFFDVFPLLIMILRRMIYVHFGPLSLCG